MPGRVGHIIELNKDGTCRAINERTQEAWYGRLSIMSGGMIVFDLIPDNERLGGYDPEHYEGDSFVPDEPEQGFQPQRKKRGTPVKR